ncbi:MAG: flagellar export chaperone FlgN [Solirubrobacteraceae bacterium]
MTVMEYVEHYDPALTTDVIAHLDAQLVSARRLLQIVLDQGVAIRNRDVPNVVSLTGMLQAELQRRAMIERDRALLLDRAGARLGVAPTAVSISQLDAVMDPVRAPEAHSRSAELRGLLEEVQREHHVNRALMNQELAFLDHLLRLADSDRHLGYDSAGDHSPMTARRLSPRHRVLDLEV